MADKVSDRLLRVHRIAVQPIKIPTVPAGTERIRVTPTPSHTSDNISAFLNAMDETWFALDIPRRTLQDATAGT